MNNNIITFVNCFNCMHYTLLTSTAADNKSNFIIRKNLGKCFNITFTADNNNFINFRQFRKCLNASFKNGFTADFKKHFAFVHFHSCAVARSKNYCYIIQFFLSFQAPQYWELQILFYNQYR